MRCNCTSLPHHPLCIKRGMPDTPSSDVPERFEPCPSCKQYSHSIREDAVAKAFMHFQTLIAHPIRGHPMGEAFDEQTRDAAQVLTATIERLSAELERVTEVLRLFVGSAYPVAAEINKRGFNWCEAYLDSARTEALAALTHAPRHEK